MPQLAKQFLRTLLLWHLPLRIFLEHFLVAQTPPVSWQPATEVEVQSIWSDEQIGWFATENEVGKRHSPDACLIQRYGELVVTPSMRERQPHTMCRGGDKGSGGGGGVGGAGGGAGGEGDSGKGDGGGAVATSTLTPVAVETVGETAATLTPSALPSMLGGVATNACAAT